MIKKIAEETLPERWTPDLLPTKRFADLCLEWKSGERKGEGSACLRVGNEEGFCDFLALYRRDATPQQLSLAVTQVVALARRENLLPLLLVPYLKEEQLLEMEKQSVSVLDLCGNGVLKAPGHFNVFRTGFPNRFTSSRPLKNAYQGASSLIARAFLLQPEYAAIGDLQQEIIRRGGDVSLSTLSKALTELEADMIVQRVRQEQKPQARSLRLLQPEKLLDRLTQNYVAPKVQRSFVGKASLDEAALREALQASAKGREARLIATGVGSASRYAALAMEPTLYLYTDALDALIKDLPVTSTTRFPNLHIRQTEDMTAYFDPRSDEEGFPWASPLTAYLEMQGSEERLQQSAAQVRERLLKSVSKKSEERA